MNKEKKIKLSFTLDLQQYKAFILLMEETKTSLLLAEELLSKALKEDVNSEAATLNLAKHHAMVVLELGIVNEILETRRSAPEDRRIITR